MMRILREDHSRLGANNGRRIASPESLVLLAPNSETRVDGRFDDIAETRAEG